jgi:hypothetical protein
MPWIVLHHVPPKHGPDVSGLELEASELLESYQPDYFVSGHDHAFPYESGQSWNQRLGHVPLLVPGQLLGAPLPNRWLTTSETWIPEDRLFGHLVLKLTKSLNAPQGEERAPSHLGSGLPSSLILTTEKAFYYPSG